MITPLLPIQVLDRLRDALAAAEFTPDGVVEVLGPVGQSCLDRGDLLGAQRELPTGEALSSLVRLFLLGLPVAEDELRDALTSLTVADMRGLLEASAGEVRARVEVRPYGEQGGEPWWVVSDFGSDVRPGPLAPEHVLGIGTASLLLAQLTVRAPVEHALDVGTGCGIQALHLGGHASSVTATDISGRALAMAATTAALSGHTWQLREGSLLEPALGERYDLVVANPPFVISPGLSTATGGYDYRDSGLAGDALCRTLVQGLPAVLVPGGRAQLLANWAITAEQQWEEHLAEWLAPTGLDAWIWQREIAGPSEYVSLWLRDAGEQPGTERWRQRYDAWLDWMAAERIVAVGMGAIALWNSGRAAPIVVCEDVPQAVEQPAGPAIAAWLPRQHYLSETSDAQLLDAPLRAADGLVRIRHDLLAGRMWQTELEQLRQSRGMRWELETDTSVAGLLAACDGATPLRVPLSLLAAAHNVGPDALAAALLPVVRDLISRGFLLPEGLQ